MGKSKKEKCWKDENYILQEFQVQIYLLISLGYFALSPTLKELASLNNIISACLFGFKQMRDNWHNILGSLLFLIGEPALQACWSPEVTSDKSNFMSELLVV